MFEYNGKKKWIENDKAYLRVKRDNPWCLNFESPIGKRSIGEIECENK